MIKDETQLVTPTEAAALKGMSLNSFKYRIATQGGLERVIVGDGHVFYMREAVKAWNPVVQVKKKR